MKTLRTRALVALVGALPVVALAGSQPAGAAFEAPPGFAVTARYQVAPGVEHLRLVGQAPPLVVNVARIAPSAPADLRVVSAFDKVGPRRRGEALEHSSAMCARVGCAVAVNGDFHRPSTDEPFGGVVSDGRLLRSPSPQRSQVWRTSDGKLAVGGLGWSGRLIPSRGAAITLAGVNVSREPDGVVLYTPEYGTSTRAGATELIVRFDQAPALGTDVGAELVGTANGGTNIPAGGAILAGEGAGATALLDLWHRRSGAGPITLRLDADATESVGIFPVLVSQGRPVTPDIRGDFVTGRHGRTLVGSTADGTLLLVTLDEQRAESRGATLAEATDLLLALGVVEGGNLDGGGGSTFVVEGKVANTPTDGPGSPASRPYGDVLPHQYAPGRFERTASNILAILPRAVAPEGTGASPGLPGPGAAVPPGAGGVPAQDLFDGDVPGVASYSELVLGSGGGGGAGALAASLLAPESSSTPLASGSTFFKLVNLARAKTGAAVTLENPSFPPL
ncbi:MAG: phosphodiester glycosidase family protein, partial [Acidimicrobiia bacterium]